MSATKENGSNSEREIPENIKKLILKLDPKYYGPLETAIESLLEYQDSEDSSKE